MGTFPKTNNLRENYKQAERTIINHYDLDDPIDEIRAEEDIENQRGKYILDISKAHEKESKAYEKNNVYYQGCRLEYYKKHYPTRLKEFLKKQNEDAAEEDFIVEELKRPEVNTFLFNERLSSGISFSLLRTQAFLKEKMRDLGSRLIEEISSGKKVYSYEQEAVGSEWDEEVVNDKFPRLNGPQRTILLNELGVIDLIKEKITRGWSTNKIASIVAEITGEKITTVQPRLNSIHNPSSNAQDKNPYTAEGSKEKVEDFLRKHDIFI